MVQKISAKVKIRLGYVHIKLVEDVTFYKPCEFLVREDLGDNE